MKQTKRDTIVLLLELKVTLRYTFRLLVLKYEMDYIYNADFIFYFR